MKKFTLLLFATVAFLFVTSFSLNATLLLKENFDYSAGGAGDSLRGTPNWLSIGTSATPGVNPIMIASGALTYSGYPSSGVGNKVTMTTSGEDDVRLFPRQVADSVYAAFLVNVTSAPNTTGDYFFSFTCNPYDNTIYHGRVYVKRDASNNLAFGVVRSTTVATTWSSFSYSLNTTYLIVLKYKIIAADKNDICRLIVNPTIASEPAVSSWLTIGTDANAENTNLIGGIALRQGTASSAPGVQVSGIRVATSWADLMDTNASVSGLNITSDDANLYGQASATNSIIRAIKVSGTGLTSDVVFTQIGTTKYSQLSLDGVTFSDNLTITNSAATLPETTVYFRMKVGGAAGNNVYNVTSTGVKTAYMKFTGVTGTGAAVITTTKTSMTGLDYTQPSTGPSAEQTFTVSGAFLAGDITVTAPTGFEVSTTSGSGFASSVNLTPTSGAVATTTIYVRLASGLGMGPKEGTLTITSAGATTANVSLSGFANRPINTNSSITTSATALSGFYYNQPGSGPSSEQTFNVSASGLTNEIIINPPANFEISKTSGTGFTSSPISLTPVSGVVLETPIYVRLKTGLSENTYSGSITLTSVGATTGTVALTGAVTSTPAIFISPTTLIGYKYTIGEGPSAVQSFTISGANLTAGITITAPTNYEISAVSGDLFSPRSSITIAQTGGVVSSTTIYVRLKAGLLVNSYNENITLSSTGAVTQYLSCMGNVSNPPAVGVSVSSLSGFTYFQGAGPSSPQSFKVSGNDLTSGVTITPPTEFEISTNLGNSYTSSAVTLALTNSNLVDSTIYVRLKSGLPPYSYGYSGNITISSTGVTSKTITLNGIVKNTPTISTSVTSLTGFNYYQGVGPSSIQSFEATGSYLVDTLVIKAPVNYEISQTGGGSFVPKSILKYVQTAKDSVFTVYVRLKSGLSVNTYSGNIELSTTSGISKSVSLSGTIVNLPLISSSTTSVNGLNYIFSHGPSAEQSFTVSGSYLNSVLLINAPTRCEISTSTGASFSPSNQILLTQSGGVAGPTTIFVRLKSGLPVNDYTDSLTITSTDAVTKKIYFSGVVSVPTLSVSKTSVSLTKYIVNNGPSVVQSFDVSGLNLPSNITISAPVNFEISKLPASDFTSSIQLSPVDNLVPNTTLYVRLISGLSVADYSGSISITSEGAAPKTVDLISKVVNPPTMSQAMGGFDYCVGAGPSAENIVVVYAANLDSNVVVTPPANFEISLKPLADGGIYTNIPLTILPSNGVVDYLKIYVRLSSGLPQGVYSDNLQIKSYGASSIVIPLRGVVNLGTGQALINSSNTMRVTTTPNNIKISGTNAGDKIEIYSVSGRMVKAANAENGETNIKTSGRNVYVVKVITKE